ncbi:MAG: hypothetical protein AABZ11_06860 [Nitrospinota bacterium]|jgi:hypothetical protein
MKTIVTFLVAAAICAVYFFTLDNILMKAQGLNLFVQEEKTEAKSSH